MIRRHANLLTIALGIAVAASVAIHAAITWRSMYAPVRPPKRHMSVTQVLPVDPLATARPAPSDSVETTRIAADVSALGFDLRGVVVGVPSSTSTALIAVAGAPAKAFAIGDTVPGGAIIDAIEFDLVVLRIDGRLRTLGFAKSSPDSLAAPSTSAPMSGGSAAAAFERQDQAMPEPPDQAGGSVRGQMAGDLSRGGSVSGEPVSAINRQDGSGR